MIKPAKFISKILILCVIILFVSYYSLLLTIPDINFLKDHNPTRSSYMLDDSEYNLKKYPLKFISLKDMSRSTFTAILVSEDDLFFKHHGFNWSELIKSFKLNIKKKRYVRGASTITQQLARNLFLSKDKSILRKVREWILTYKLESTLEKDRILELYLNLAEFGPSIYGIQSASKYHFNKPPAKISSKQSALLAAVLPNPKRLGQKPYPNSTYKRQKRIVSRMHRYGVWLPKHLRGKTWKPPAIKRPSKHVAKQDSKIDFSVPDDINSEDIFLDE
jgi:monofunctional glycosyltransferase